MSASTKERLFELMADRATDQLGEPEAAELDTLLGRYPETAGDDLELAAAAVHVVFLQQTETEAMSPHLRHSLRVAARRFGSPENET